jgi:aminoglycoside/choline kinase family phosphotransferase
MNSFVSYFVTRFLGVNLPPERVSYLEDLFFSVAGVLSVFPEKVFCHKDCNSTNIILRDSDACFIDFQSTLRTTRAYDLVSLLTDNYVRLDPRQVNEGIQYYLRIQHISDITAFRRQFLLCLFHRHVKTLGTFTLLHCNGNSRISII